MKTLSLLCLSLFALVGAGGCVAYTGLDKNIMYTNTRLDVAVIPEEGFTPLQSGTMYLDLETDTNLGARTRAHYVIYGDTEEGPVKRHGHVIFVDILNSNQFQFVPETFSDRNDMNLRTVKIEGRSWNEHARFEEYEGDWITRWWTVNGRKSPQLWIGKRWSRNEDPFNRIIVEYREPLPGCARIKDKQLLDIFQGTAIDYPNDECKSEVNAVFERADKAFSIKRSSKMNLGQDAPANILNEFPTGGMDANRHIGKAQMTSPPVN
ncbi:MAG: DUF4851 domain-containing protein [Deltaproteobacteria bacterium]|jgi:hypothetical protein|nr:DUF4851 domain-containing protein [Deltaproteobacteria bacterium]